MVRLIKLTELVVSRGVPLSDVSMMVLYLVPSFLVFTIPMALLLAVLLAFGRLSSDNEIIVIKASGISLGQIMPPVLFSAFIAMCLALAASTVAVPWGNSSFKKLSFNMLKQNITATVREKTFWDDIPGVVMYTDQYDEQSRTLKGVIIHDGRNYDRPMTIFAQGGTITGTSENQQLLLSLHDGSIHIAGAKDLYRLVKFGEYSMTVGDSGDKSEVPLNETDLRLSELQLKIEDPISTGKNRIKFQLEYHSRFTFPFACIVFAVLAIPLGIQNRRSGKSGGFAVSISIILIYYVFISVARTIAERGILPPWLALWTPNILFLVVACFFLHLASLEKSIPFPSLKSIYSLFKREL